MNYGTLDTALSAAAGDDIALAADLRRAFTESAERQISLMARSRCDANWNYSSMRLRGLAASFGVTTMMKLADEAMEGAPGDPVVLRKLLQSLDDVKTA